MAYDGPFPIPAETSIVSYDFYDIAEGTGIKMFYLAAVNGDNILTTNQIYSNSIELSSGSHSLTTDYVKNQDVDFDLSSFNTPRVITGTAYMNFTCHIYKAGSQVVTAKWIIKVRKWDGTTETEIGSAETTELASSTASDHYILTALEIPLTETNFNVGDVLRVTVEGWDKEASADSTNILIIGQDPMNRDGTYIIPSTDSPVSITQSKIWIPFKVFL